jgi:hypothetical protein
MFRIIVQTKDARYYQKTSWKTGWHKEIQTTPGIMFIPHRYLDFTVSKTG